MKPAKMLTHNFQISFADFAGLFLFSQIDKIGNSKRGSYQ
jgi:hypothetical protein